MKLEKWQHLSNVILLPNVALLLLNKPTGLNPAWTLGYFDLSTNSVDNPVGGMKKQAAKPCAVGERLKLHHFGCQKINLIKSI